MASSPKKQKFSWQEYFSILEKLKENIDYRPDVIISIGKGGSIPGVILAEYYGVLNLNLGVKSYTKYEQNGLEEYQTFDQQNVKKQNVLLVDDLTDSGVTLKYATEKLQKAECKSVKTACLFLKDASAYTPDFFVKTIPSTTWIVQPWEKE